MRHLLGLLLVVSWPAIAGENAESGQRLDDKLLSHDAQIQILQGNVSELDMRLKAIEEGVPVPPPDPGEEGPVEGVEPGQEPFAQHRLPVRIEAEHYDLGGEGIAYHDTTPENKGGKHRADGVDIKLTGDSEGVHQVGWIKAGEWLEFTVGAQAFTYDIKFRTSSAETQPGNITLKISGVEVGSVNVKSTGSYDNSYSTQWIRDVPVQSGDQVWRFEFSGNNFDWNWFEVVPSGSAMNHAPTGILLCEEDLTGCVDGSGTAVRCILNDDGTHCIAVAPI